MSLRHYHCAFFQKISNETLKGKCLLKNKHLPCSAYPRCADFVDKKDTTKAEATICYEACKEDSNALREEFIELVKETNKQKSRPYDEHLLSVEDKLESDKGVDLQYYKVKCADLETGYLDLQKENKKLKEGYKHHISELKGENEILTKENEKLKDENIEIIHDRLGFEEDIDMLLKKNEEFKKENRQLKYEIEMLKEVNEQNKALIENRWNEYLKKKEVEEND